MSTGSRRWTLREDRLAEVIGAWQSLDPSRAERGIVHEFLMDLVIDPLRCGVEDGDSGIFMGRASPGIVVMYVPDFDRREVTVALIAYG